IDTQADQAADQIVIVFPGRDAHELLYGAVEVAVQIFGRLGKQFRDVFGGPSYAGETAIKGRPGVFAGDGLNGAVHLVKSSLAEAREDTTLFDIGQKDCDAGRAAAQREWLPLEFVVHFTLLFG